MTHALSPAGLARVQEFVGEHALFAFDIDGTLAPIVAQPGDANIPDRSQQLLKALSREHIVAVITGRGLSDARRMLQFTPRYLVGSHGAEGVPGMELESESYATTSSLWLQALRVPDAPWRSIPGVTLEEKATSLAFHYRNATNHDEARRDLELQIARLSPGPRVVGGKCVLNLVPENAPHKGDALRSLLALSRCDRALYVGDDLTDEDVFRLRLPGVLSVRVDPIASSAAELFLTDQQEVEALLEALVMILQASLTDEPSGS